MTDYSFLAFTTVECSTKRITSTTSGFAENLVDLLCTPIAPVDAETRQRLQINTPVTLWEVHLQDAPDIKAGDRLLIGTTEYPIKTVEPYYWLPSGDTRLRLILEDTRN